MKSDLELEKEEKLYYQTTVVFHDTLKKLGDKYRIEFPELPPFNCSMRARQEFFRSLNIQAAKLSPKLNLEEKKEIVYVGAAIGVQIDGDMAN